ncbi:MAG: undecaprenyl diphosphate synthase family protein [Nitrosomonas sp.]|nr:undecaprenyl diphosphate synthase family protein [Nitrosomonas sp.]
MKFSVPKHVGFIPDGNRRWALQQGLPKEAGYDWGINPGLQLFEQCLKYDIEEASIFCFTQDNTKRPSLQKNAFRKATVTFALEIERRGAALLVLGDQTSAQFPEELMKFRQRQGNGIRVNLLVNYGWKWDLEGFKDNDLQSKEIPPVDMIVRWGGSSRLSGFLPIQSVYADFFVIKEYWPDFNPMHFDNALAWFRKQDKTLGG